MCVVCEITKDRPQQAIYLLMFYLNFPPCISEYFNTFYELLFKIIVNILTKCLKFKKLFFISNFCPYGAALRIRGKKKNIKTAEDGKFFRESIYFALWLERSSTLVEHFVPHLNFYTLNSSTFSHRPELVLGPAFRSS